MNPPSSLRLKQKVIPQSQSQNAPSSLKPKKKFKEEDFPSDEEIERQSERAQAQLLSRAAESVLGAPGDIASFGAGLFGKEQNLLPTSRKIREFSESATGGYTAPKTEFEEGVGELVSDIATMALPGAGHYSLARNLGIPVVGNLLKQGLKYSNADEKSQAYGKVGTMVALDLLSRRAGGVNAYKNSLFQKADSLLPEGVMIDATGLQKSLDKLEKSLTAGGARPTTKKALEKVSEIRKEIQDGKIDAQRLAAYRPSINEAISEMGGFQMEVPRKLIPQTKRNLNDVKGEVIKTLEDYGSKQNPEFLNTWKAANEANAAIERSNLIANFIEKKLKYTPKHAATKALFSYGPHAAVTGAGFVSPATTAAGLGAAGAYQGVKVLHRVINSPVLRKYYQNFLKEAASGNVPEATKNLKALDENLKSQKD